MIDVGRLCVKTAGRDAGKTCVVVDHIGSNAVLIDGGVRRRACNPVHLEPLAERIDLKKGANHGEVAAAFERRGLPVWSTKLKKSSSRPTRRRKARETEVEETSGQRTAERARESAMQKKKAESITDQEKNA